MQRSAIRRLVCASCGQMSLQKSSSSSNMLEPDNTLLLSLLTACTLSVSRALASHFQTAPSSFRSSSFHLLMFLILCSSSAESIAAESHCLLLSKLLRSVRSRGQLKNSPLRKLSLFCVCQAMSRLNRRLSHRLQATQGVHAQLQGLRP